MPNSKYTIALSVYYTRLILTYLLAYKKEYNISAMRFHLTGGRRRAAIINIWDPTSVALQSS